VYEQKKDGEYIVFPFLNNYPYGCKIMIGPFINKKDAEILFQLYVPRYVYKADSFSSIDTTERDNIVPLLLSGREMPLSVSLPLNDSCLIKLEQEDCYNAYIPSFSFDDRDSCAPYRRNYAEIAFALGQRAKYVFLHAMIFQQAKLLHERITELEKIDPAAIYPSDPWKLDESGDLVF
ncbi:MAG: hypothetical protein LBI28_02055, partial [Treponema sp.]|nr:hypothetical protein [Treponema sp.]